jgi:hypothetical protein
MNDFNHFCPAHAQHQFSTMPSIHSASIQHGAIISITISLSAKVMSVGLKLCRSVGLKLCRSIEGIARQKTFLRLAFRIGAPGQCEHSTLRGSCYCAESQRATFGYGRSRRLNAEWSIHRKTTPAMQCSGPGPMVKRMPASLPRHVRNLFRQFLPMQVPQGASQPHANFLNVA